MYEAHGG
jgi:hypothetical protein